MFKYGVFYYRQYTEEPSASSAGDAFVSPCYSVSNHIVVMDGAGLESRETISYTATVMWSSSMIALLQNGKILLMFLQSKALSQRLVKSYQQTQTEPKSERESGLIPLSLEKQVSSGWNNNKITITEDGIYWGWIRDLQENTEKGISPPFSCSRNSSGSKKRGARKSEPPAGAERINRAV